MNGGGILSIDIGEIKDLIQLGQYLKNIREQRNVSLEDIHKETKIRKRYLTAMESGDFNIIPGGDVYIKGFLRNYSLCIGIEPSSIIELYSKLSGEKKEEKNVAVSSNTNTDTIQIDVFSSKFGNFIEQNYKKILAIILSGLLVIVLIISIRALIGRQLPGDKVLQPVKTPLTQEPPPKIIEKSSSEETPMVEEKNVLVELVEDTSQNTVYEIDDNNIEVTLGDITGRCWISVQKDGKKDFEGILNQGDTKTWKASENIKIRIGNPPVVKLIVNGKDLGRPKEGARDFVFKKRTR